MRNTVLDGLSRDARRVVLRLLNASDTGFVPMVLVQMVVLVYSIPGLVDALPKDVKSVEFFAGLGALTLGMEQRGFRALAYEKLNVSSWAHWATQDHYHHGGSLI